MARRRIQQMVALLFVLALVGGVLAVGTGSSGSEESAPTTVARRLDQDRCDATVTEMKNSLDEGFRTAGDSDANDDVSVTDQAAWDDFFVDVAASCADINAVISDLVVFTHDEAESAADPALQLLPLFVTAQLCTIDAVVFVPDAAEICRTASDEATSALDEVFGDAFGGGGVGLTPATDG